MKILQVVNDLGFGGAEKLVADISILLSKGGHEVEILVINKNDMKYETKVEKEGIKVKSLGINSFYNPKVVFKLLKYMNQYDLIHVHLFPLQYWVVFAKILSRSRTPLVTTEHSTFNRRRVFCAFRFIDQFIYRYYRRIISISDKTEKELCKYLRERDERFLVVHNGIDVNLFNETVGYSKRDLLGVCDNIKLITMVGLFRQAKDQDSLIKAIARLDGKVHLVLVGDGDRRNELENLIQRLGLAKRVHLLGRRSDVAEILKTSDVVVQSSNWEGFGLAAVEGMAAGKPVVVSDVEGLADIVDGAGILFQLKNERQLSEILQRLLNDTNYYSEISLACLSRAWEYDQKYMVQSYIKIYQQLLKR